ncbi:Rad4-domain-containing protein [Rhodotorula sp. JG-1b]|nr:Rad4-domain-containing protein [Rhodotorula sp. JG-1b]
MSRYSTPLGSASASASASASESDYAVGRFPSNASTPNRHPLAAGYADQGYGGDHDHEQDADEEEEEEEAWDEVDIPQAAPPPPPLGSTADSLNAGTAEHGSATAGAGGAGIEIVIGRAPPKAKGNKAGKPRSNARGSAHSKGKGETARERMVRQERHKAHVMALLAMGLIRNRWLNDPELQARLVSQVPAALLNAFAHITPTRYPNARDRSRLFDRALSDLTSWWYTAFEIVPGKELSRRDVVEVEQEVESWEEEGERLRAKAQKRLDKEKDRAKRDVKGKGKAREPPLDPERIPLFPWQESPYLLTTSQRIAALDKSASTSKLPLHPASGQLIRPYEPASSSWEVLRPPPIEHKQTLNLAASTLRGSKDLSAQLFVALLRAIDIPARLVVSLQALEWRSRAQTTAPPARSRKTKVAATASTARRGGKAPGDNKKKKKATAPVIRKTHFDTTTDDDDADFVAVDQEADRQKSRSKAKSTAAPQSKAKATSAAKSGTSSAASDGSRPPRPTNGKGRSGANTTDPDVLVLSSSASAATSASDTDGSFEDGRGKLKYKVPKVNLRGPSSGAKVAAWKKDQQLRRGTSPDAYELSIAPAQWVEAYTRYNKEWIVVDPVRKRMRCAKLMEPPRAAARGGGAGNVLAYVVAYEEDGSARDVTPRYARAFVNVTLKSRVPTSSKVRKENGGSDWFAGMIAPFGRGFKLNRDVEEEEELWHRQANAPMPTSIGGFKSHPNYVLEQHLHRDEALRPGSKSLGLFKGEFTIFRRSDVVNVRSTENWYRTGRVVKSNEIPMKFVKQRAVTIHQRREEELAKMDGGEVDEQPLYAEEQTETYIPPPVVDGKVPKNNFGNIDLFVPSMLPAGAVHLRSKYAAKCAKELGIDYGEAIMGFEFRQRRALPVISGIVVAQEHEDTLRAAVATLEQSTYERELAKQQDRVLKRWKKLIQGLRIRQRLLDQFSQPEQATEPASVVRSLDRCLSASGTSAAIAQPSASETGPATSRLGKRPTISPSPSEEAPLPKRPARFAEPGSLSGKSTTGRSLRVRMPKAEEPPSNGHTPRRTTRSSARSVVGASDSTEEGPKGTGASAGMEGKPKGDEAQGDEVSASEGSEGGFEFDDDF